MKDFAAVAEDWLESGFDSDNRIDTFVAKLFAEYFDTRSKRVRVGKQRCNILKDNTRFWEVRNIAYQPRNSLDSTVAHVSSVLMRIA